MSVEEQQKMLGRFEAAERRQKSEKEYPAYKDCTAAYNALERFLYSPKKDIPFTEEESQKIVAAMKVLD